MGLSLLKQIFLKLGLIILKISPKHIKKLNEISGTKLIKYDEIRPKLLGKLLGTPSSKAYFIIEALAKSKTINGDICEFVVAQGNTSALIANEIKKQDKKLHLFDSFEGLPRPSSMDQLKVDIFSLGSIKAYTGAMSCSEIMVISRLKELLFLKTDI